MKKFRALLGLLIAVPGFIVLLIGCVVARGLDDTADMVDSIEWPE